MHAALGQCLGRVELRLHSCYAPLIPPVTLLLYLQSCFAVTLLFVGSGLRKRWLCLVVPGLRSVPQDQLQRLMR